MTPDKYDEMAKKIVSDYADVDVQWCRQTIAAAIRGAAEEAVNVECERLRAFLREAISTATSGYRAGAISVEKWKAALDGGKP